jgi:predicted anti-sigma-YlaC factor YlaD
MSDHVFDLLGAYLDGELQGGQLRRVETHLEVCQDCQEEYRSLQALSWALQAAPVPDFPAPERLAADVALRLPRFPVKPVSRRVLEFGWWLVPAGLIATWVFIGTTILVSEMVTTASEFGLLQSISAQLIPNSLAGAYWSSTLGQFGILSGSSLQWAEITETFTRATVPLITWQVSIALLYLSWMAIWWARHTRRGSGEPLNSGSRPTVN